MKKLLLMLLLLPVMAGANDLSVVYSDAILADSNGTRTDTVYTPYMNISSFGRLWITATVAGEWNDTSFTNDSFFVFFQQSSDRVTWTTTADDTLQKIKKGANDTIVNIATSIHRDSVHVGNWGRVKFLHRNALTNQQALTSNVYKKRLTAWINSVP